MTGQQPPILVNLGDTGLAIADPAKDIRGRAVVNHAGEAIGDVKELFLDDREHRVRFLSVGSGGFLGMRQHTLLVPVEAITRIENDEIHVDLTRTAATDGPGYDPVVTRKPAYRPDAFSQQDQRTGTSRDFIGPIYPRYPHDWR